MALAVKVDMYQSVTDRIVAMLGTAGGLKGFKKPWVTAAGSGMPASLAGRPYRGINVFLLAGAALLLGIPVYLSQRHNLTEPQPVPPYPEGRRTAGSTPS